MSREDGVVGRTKKMRSHVQLELVLERGDGTRSNLIA